MKATPYVILAVVVLLALLRRQMMRRHGGGSRTPAGGLRGLVRRAPSLLGDTGLVAAREVRERVRGRFFKIVTLVLLLVVGAAIVIPTIGRGPAAAERVGVVGDLSAPLRASVTLAAQRAGVRVALVDEPSLERARSALRSGEVRLVIDDHRQLMTKTPLSAGNSTKNAQAVRSVASVLGIDNAFRAAGLSLGQATAIAHAKALPVTSLQRSTVNSTARATSVVGAVLIFIMLTQYLTWTLMGVMEEKSSRVVEVLLATVRPLQLLAGKVLGIGLVALAQAALVVAVALGLAKAVGSSLLQGTAPLVVVTTLVWLVLGYAFYSWVYAAAGSMVERQDQVQSLALPLSLPLILGYIVALTSAGSANPSLLVEILAYLPPTAPFAMPMVVASGHAPWWAFLASVLVTVVCTFGVARLAAAVYRRAVLRTGRRVRIRELLASGG